MSTLADRETSSPCSTRWNPSVIGGHTADAASYPWKYPFGTFQWLWWLEAMEAPGVNDSVATGLVWMPDGGFGSINNRWRDNCVDWALRRLPNSPLAPMAVEELRRLTPRCHVGGVAVPRRHERRP